MYLTSLTVPTCFWILFDSEKDIELHSISPLRALNSYIYFCVQTLTVDGFIPNLQSLHCFSHKFLCLQESMYT